VILKEDKVLRHNNYYQCATTSWFSQCGYAWKMAVLYHHVRDRLLNERIPIASSKRKPG